MKDQLCLVLGDPSQSGKKVCFTACHLDKLTLAFTSPNVISTSPKHVLMVRIDLTIPSSKKLLWPVGQVKNMRFTFDIKKLLLIDALTFIRGETQDDALRIAIDLCEFC